jgi:hypothetical protein
MPTRLDVDLVATEDDRDAFADAFQVAIPVRDGAVGDLGRHVKHDDTALALDVVAITETAKLFLSRLSHRVSSVWTGSVKITVSHT